MNLYFRVIYGSACRNTHDRLALDALRFLQHTNAPQWQTLFLRHHRVYLDGAQAPDVKFRDFRNHVLYVGGDEWGGAVEATRRWFDTTVDALATQRWKAAAYSAGVLGHYFTDVTQAFQTQQSAAANNIRRAADWSLFRSYRAIYQLGVTESHFHPVPIPVGDDWLEQMVRQAAEHAAPHYETLVNEFDFDVGVDAPASAYTAPCRAILAQLLGRAVVGLAHILDRALLEADVTPPAGKFNMQCATESAAVPMRWLTGWIRDVRERAAVESMYREYKMTGRVERHLPEQDRVIRDLHATEATTSRSPTFSGSGEGANASESRQSHDTAGSPTAGANARLRFYLKFSDVVDDIPLFGTETAKVLNQHGIRTVADLLAADPFATATAVGSHDCSSDAIQDWQDQARLVCQIPKLAWPEAQLLISSGYRSVDAIANAEHETLLQDLEGVLESHSLQERVFDATPNLQEAGNWIAWSQRARFLRAA